MFEEVMPFDVAMKEVSTFMDKKKIYPRRRQALQGIMEIVAEAIQYGQVVINDDGSICQTLLEPVVDQNKTVVLAKLEYKARVEPSVINKMIQDNKVPGTDARNMIYTTAYSGEGAGMINKLESTDRNTCDAITLFFV